MMEKGISGHLHGMTALIAGAGSGIGSACARILAESGASVMVTDRDGASAQAVAEALRAEGRSATACEMDVSDQSHIDAAVAKIAAEFGQLDILVNSAGVIAPAALETCDLGDWRKCFTVNVEGALILARSCLPLLRHSGNAAIVNVGSLAGGQAYPNGGGYGPSKAALISLTRQMALEWASEGIRVNIVSPGTIDTPMTRTNMTPQIVRQREEKIPLGRLGSADELARTVLFLASPAASFVTGQELLCDGGMSHSLMVQKFQTAR